MTATAQPGTNPDVCYGIADQTDATNNDALLVMDRLPPFTPLHTGTLIGNLGRTNVETAALSLDASVIYAVDDTNPDTLGTVNINTGAWTTIGSIGQATNPFLFGGAPIDMEDIDSLSLHPLTGEMWGLTHTSGAIYLFRIDLNTGAIMPDTYGVGYDYVQLDYSNLVGIPGGTTAPTESDDLGIHPITGAFYIIANGASGSGANDQLVQINIDGVTPSASPGLNSPAPGMMSLTSIGVLRDASNNIITDMEGFAFFNDGTFYGSTGDQSSVGTNDDTLWRINETTGVVTRIGTFDEPGDGINHHDFEGVACLTGGANRMAGQVFCEPVASFDGVFNAGDTPQAGVAMRLYVDRNNDGQVDAGDTYIQTRTTDGSGNFNFAVGIAGSFIMEMDGTVIPVGAIRTTHPALPADPVEEADFFSLGPMFSEYGQTDNDNAYGFTCSAVPPTLTPTPTNTPVPTQPPAQLTPGATPVITTLLTPDPNSPGQPEPDDYRVRKIGFKRTDNEIEWVISVTNTGSTQLSNLYFTDTLPAGLRLISVNIADGQYDSVGQVVNVIINSLAPGQSATFSIFTLIVDESQAINFVCMNDRADGSCVAGEIVQSLPATGESQAWRWVLPFMAAFLSLILGAEIYWRKSR